MAESGKNNLQIEASNMIKSLKRLKRIILNDF